MPIKLVAFDIGGVLAIVDKSPLKEFFGSDQTRYKRFFDKHFWHFQRGLIAPRTFLLQKCFLLGVDQILLSHLFEAMVRAHENSKRILKLLACPYIFASNINVIHYEQFINSIKPSNFALMNSALSCQIGHLKPKKKFFDYLITKTHLKPGQIVFIDDGLPNVAAAHLAGLHARWCKGPHELPGLLADLGLMVPPSPAPCSSQAADEGSPSRHN